MMKHATRHACSLMAAVLVPATAWAHPGHGAGGGDWSVLHYVSEPDHLLSAVALVVVVAGPLLRGAIRAHQASTHTKDSR